MYTMVSEMLLHLLLLSIYLSETCAVSQGTSKGTAAKTIKQSFYAALETRPRAAMQVDSIVKELTSSNVIKMTKMGLPCH